MTEPFFPLQPGHTHGPAQPQQPDGQPLQQPIIAGRILFERLAFFGQSFDEHDLEVVEYFKALLNEMSVRCATGERAEAKSVSEKVKQRIAEGDIFIGVLTRREPTEDGKFRTSEWVVQEIAYAAGLGKKVVVLKERDIVSIGGIHGDAEYVEFDRNALHKAGLKLIQMIWSLNPGQVAFTKNQPPHLNISVLEAAVAAQPREPMLRLNLAQIRAASGQMDAALRDLAETLRIFPDFGPARLEYIKGLRTAGRTKEAEQEVLRFLESHPFDGPAHHHLAHILEVKKDYKGARREFEAAQTYAPGDSSNYRCLGLLLYRTAAGDRRHLMEAKEPLETAIELGGQPETPNCTQFIKAIKKLLKKSTPQSRPRRGRRR